MLIAKHTNINLIHLLALIIRSILFNTNLEMDEHTVFHIPLELGCDTFHYRTDNYGT